MLLFAVVLALLAVRSLADLDVAYLRWLHRAIFWARTGAGRLSLRNSRLYSGPTCLQRRDRGVCARRVWLSLALMGMRVNLHRFSPMCLLFPYLLSLYLRRAATLYYSQFLLWSNCFFYG
jgi:hypothetical protein